MSEIRGLTLHEPHASLMARINPDTGQPWKSIETRSWPTPKTVRLPCWLLVHAAAQWDVDLCRLAFDEPFRSALGLQDDLDAYLDRSGTELRRGPKPPLPLGAVLAVVRLVECREMAGLLTGVLAEWVWALDAGELAFGRYLPGRYGWVTDRMRPLREPIPCRGGQRLWRPSAELVARVEAQLGGPIDG